MCHVTCAIVLCFGIFSTNMNSCIIFWISKDYTEFIVRFYATKAIYIIHQSSNLYWHSVEQVMKLVGHEGSQNMQILHGIPSTSWNTVDTSYFPNMLNYRYHSRFVTLTLYLIFICFYRFYKVALLVLDIERNSLPV